MEDFTAKTLDVLGKLDKLGEIVRNPVLPDDLPGAKEMIEEHNHLKKKMAKVPVNSLDEEGQRIIHRISGRHASQAGEMLNGLVFRCFTGVI